MDVQWDILAEIPSLTGRVAIVTGANSPNGIGYHIAHQVAIKGAQVFVGARSLQKAENAIYTMRQSTPSLCAGQLKPLVMDLNDFHQVQRIAKDLVANESRLDILVNNATRMAMPLVKDKFGISISFGTNFLGPFLFTTELLPLLAKTAKISPGVRVVNVSSRVHEALPDGIKLSSLENFNQTLGAEDDHPSNRLRYGLSKLAIILFTKELQRRAQMENLAIQCMSMHPGGVRTDGVTTYYGGEGDPRLKGLLTPLDGALTPLFAAGHPMPWTEKDKYAGAYLTPFGVVTETTEDSRNMELAANLWAMSERVLGDVLATCS